MSTDSSAGALEARLGHHFSDPALLKRALSHASLGPENSNERLEFLGDRVLGLIIAERLHADFPEVNEGGLAVRYNTLVRREVCAKVAHDISLDAHLILASSEAASGGRKKDAILAGAMEAVIAALYLDGGLETARRFILDHWKDSLTALAEDLRDAKTALQEWAQSGALGKKPLPQYYVKERSGPDHAPNFVIEVVVPGQPPERGHGSTKRQAEQDAAHRLLVKLGVWLQ